MFSLAHAMFLKNIFKHGHTLCLLQSTIHTIPVYTWIKKKSKKSFLLESNLILILPHLLFLQGKISKAALGADIVKT